MESDLYSCRQHNPAAFVYDYFIKDHLGDIRMVLTEQTKEELYAATMEPQNATNENKLFDNIISTTVLKPTGFDNDPNNKQVSQLDGSSGNDSQPRVGPSIVLKVMAGNTVTIGTYAWYTGTVQPPPTNATNLLNDLLSALTGGVISNSHGLYNATDNDPNTILSGDLGQFFTNDENTNYTTAAPKAFLNYIAFDNQLNEVSANSGVVQIPTITGSEQAQPLVAPEQIIQKDGYLYIYVSNESAQRVFFDNLVIHHNRGPILQTDNYYPFGLVMAGISDQAALSLENNYLFNGKLLNHKEFSDNTGLDWYSYGMREYDPQIGRFFSIDRLSDLYQNMTPYHYGSDNPILYIDANGDSTVPVNNVPNNFNNFDTKNNTIGLNVVTITATPLQKYNIQNMSLSPMGLEFIQLHEGFGKNGKNPYNDSRGFATVGYGHLLHESPITPEDVAQYKNFTKAGGLRLLKKDLEKLEPQIKAVIIVPVSQTEYDAIVSFTFNVGIGNNNPNSPNAGLTGSEFLKQLNRGNYKGTLLLHYHTPTEIIGRRNDEVTLFDAGLYLIKGKPIK
jgi:RHS repeat-associated protein